MEHQKYDEVARSNLESIVEFDTSDCFEDPYAVSKLSVQDKLTKEIKNTNKNIDKYLFDAVIGLGFGGLMYNYGHTFIDGYNLSFLGVPGTLFGIYSLYRVGTEIYNMYHLEQEEEKLK